MDFIFWILKKCPRPPQAAPPLPRSSIPSTSCFRSSQSTLPLPHSLARPPSHIYPRSRTLLFSFVCKSSFSFIFSFSYFSFPFFFSVISLLDEICKSCVFSRIPASFPRRLFTCYSSVLWVRFFSDWSSWSLTRTFVSCSCSLTYFLFLVPIICLIPHSTISTCSLSSPKHSRNLIR